MAAGSCAESVSSAAKDVLAGLGFSEIYTPSLRPDGATRWKLPDPISVELAALRTTLLPSLVEAAARNVDAGVRGIALFETIIRRGVARGEFREIPPQHAARLCVAPMLVLMLWRTVF